MREDREDDVAIKVIVELRAKPGRRDELSSLLERIIATEGPSQHGFRHHEVRRGGARLRALGCHGRAALATTVNDGRSLTPLGRRLKISGCQHDALAELLGADEVDQRQQDRRAQLCAIEDGLLRRSLLVAASPNVVS